MARARIDPSGLGVRVYLSFGEAAALLALLSRVGETTHAGIDDATLSVFDQLRDTREAVELEDASLWPDAFDAFSERNSALVDVDKN